MDPVAVARSELLRTFAWTGGHADLAAVVRSARFLEAAGPALVQPFRDDAITAVVALEARGFVLGALAARALDVGLVLARKPGSVHPDAATEVGETDDWRGRRTEFRISRRAVEPGDRLLLVDDWVETGSQARTVRQLVTRLGAELVGVTVIVDGTTDAVRSDLHLVGVVRMGDLPSAP